METFKYTNIYTSIFYTVLVFEYDIDDKLLNIIVFSSTHSTK